MVLALPERQHQPFRPTMSASNKRERFRRSRTFSHSTSCRSLSVEESSKPQFSKSCRNLFRDNEDNNNNNKSAGRSFARRTSQVPTAGSGAKKFSQRTPRRATMTGNLQKDLKMLDFAAASQELFPKRSQNKVKRATSWSSTSTHTCSTALLDEFSQNSLSTTNTNTTTLLDIGNCSFRPAEGGGFLMDDDSIANDVEKQKDNDPDNDNMEADLTALSLDPSASGRHHHRRRSSLGSRISGAQTQKTDLFGFVTGWRIKTKDVVQDFVDARYDTFGNNLQVINSHVDLFARNWETVGNILLRR